MKRNIFFLAFPLRMGIRTSCIGLIIFSSSLRAEESPLVVMPLSVSTPSAPTPSAPTAPTSTRTVVEDIHLEAHGFVSFGYLRTWDNHVYANDTIGGTSDFKEAALNAIARPWERIRVGAQLFMREIGRAHV